MTVTLSIIIPTLNEEHILGQTLSGLLNRKNCEIIVVDGGSSDATLSLAKSSGCKIFSTSQGRGRQMNFGAAQATGEILIFLHADTMLPGNFPQLVTDAVDLPDFAVGAFSLTINSSKKSLATIAWLTNLRSRFLGLPYGDQAFFIKSSTFAAMGGFPELEIMEDFVFIQKMKKRGRIVTLPERVKTSARRWQNMGIARTTFINQLIVCGYSLGVPPVILAKWYRRMRGVAKIYRDGGNNS